MCLVQVLESFFGANALNACGDYVIADMNLSLINGILCLCCCFTLSAHKLWICAGC